LDVEIEVKVTPLSIDHQITPADVVATTAVAYTATPVVHPQA
jgi:hypothetical protein